MNDLKRLKEMKRRRVRGVRLLQKGERPAEVARQSGVSRQSVLRWQRALASKGFLPKWRRSGAAAVRDA